LLPKKEDLLWKKIVRTLEAVEHHVLRKVAEVLEMVRLVRDRKWHSIVCGRLDDGLHRAIAHLKEPAAHTLFKIQKLLQHFKLLLPQTARSLKTRARTEDRKEMKKGMRS